MVRSNYYKNNKKQLDEKNRQYYSNTKEERRKTNRRYRFKLKITLINILGSKCVKCSSMDWSVLEFDHVNGGGTEERKIGTQKLQRYYINHIDEAKIKLRLLCANCHARETYKDFIEYISGVEI